jgi:methionine synthase II (cobalamin-independent)
MMHFEPRCLATTIGSLPLEDARKATELILTYTPQIPSWVQLAKRPREGMLIQFTEGLPGLTRSDQKLYFDTEAPGFQDDLSHFYERYLAAAENQPSAAIESFALTPSYAEGFHVFLDALNQGEYQPIALKGQVTGPFTLATSLTDQAGKSSFYNPQLRDCIVKMISLKAQWQIKKLHPFGVPVIISIDEPSLVGFGSSAYLGISASDVQKDLNEIIAHIHSHNAYAAIHCCENTDWSMLLATDIDILSFDAYSYFDKVLLYAEPLKTFIEKKGIVAWGLIPTADPVLLQRETAPSLIHKFESHLKHLGEHTMDTEQVLRYSLLTPS